MKMIRPETGRLPRDPLPELSRNALVSTAWLAARAGSDRFVVIECSSNPDAYASGHIPSAHELDWRRDLSDLDSGDLIRGEQSSALASRMGISPKTTVIFYCRIGERSSHSWFVLTQLLACQHVRNCDGSWTDCGNRSDTPLETIT